MSSDWIKMRVDLREDPAVFRLAKLTRQDRLSVVGRLWAFWSWADKHAVEGRIADADASDVDVIADKKGFADALVEVGWLSLGDGFIAIPKHDRHTDESAKERSLKNARQARWRQSRVAAVDAGPSTQTSTQTSTEASTSTSTQASTREEKRREEEKKTLRAAPADVRFPDFWSAWPATERKTDRKRCLAKWRLAKFDEQADEILAHVAAMKLTRKWTEGFEPAPLRYLNGEQWKDGTVVQAQDRFAGAI